MRPLRLRALVPPAITAITFVALGTSMPDLFASKQAAVTEDNADNSIGNITGSNSVNVFLGLGLPWTIGAVYWSVASDSAIAEWENKYQGDADVLKWMNDNPGKAAFVVPSGDLGLSVIVFCVCAFSCLATLQIRRTVFGGELGGPATPRWPPASSSSPFGSFTSPCRASSPPARSTSACEDPLVARDRRALESAAERIELRGCGPP